MASSSRPRLNMNDFLNGLNSNTPPRADAQEESPFIDFANTDFINFDFVDPALGGGVDTESTWNNQNILSPEFQFSMTGNGSSTVSPILDSSSKFSNLNSLYAAQQASQSAAAKRKLELLDPSLSPGERAKVEAEEDKRRRNTAASARFRVKKKQREQALEKTAKEMTDKANKLEEKVRQLEMENKWLKGLITEKTGEEGFGELLDQFMSQQESSASEEDRIEKRLKNETRS